MKAPTTGVVHGLQVTAGQQVLDGSVLFRLQGQSFLFLTYFELRI